MSPGAMPFDERRSVAPRRSASDGVGGGEIDEAGLIHGRTVGHAPDDPAADSRGRRGAVRLGRAMTDFAATIAAAYAAEGPAIDLGRGVHDGAARAGRRRAGRRWR